MIAHQSGNGIPLVYIRHTESLNFMGNSLWPWIIHEAPNFHKDKLAPPTERYPLHAVVGRV